MTDRTWDGSNANFNSAKHWSPPGVPQRGDTAIIGSGDVTARNGSLDIKIDLGLANPKSAPTLILSNETISSDSSVLVAPVFGNPSPFFAEMAIREVVTNAGSINVGSAVGSIAQFLPGNLNINISRFGILDNTHTINVLASHLSVTGGPHANLINDGTVDIRGGGAEIDVPVAGSGTFNVGAAAARAPLGNLTFGSSVSADEVVNLQGLGSGSNLFLFRPLEFLGSIHMQGPAPQTVVLENTPSTSSSYANGVLTVLNGVVPVAALHINEIGTGFSVVNQNGNTVITPTFQPPSGSVSLTDLVPGTASSQSLSVTGSTQLPSDPTSMNAGATLYLANGTDVAVTNLYPVTSQSSG